MATKKSERADSMSPMNSSRRWHLGRRRFLQLCVGSTFGAGLTEVAAPREAPAAAKKVTITYWTPLDHKDTKTARSRAEVAMVDLFRKKHPNIEVVVQTVPWQVIVQQTIMATAGDKGPDVVQASDRGLRALTEAGAIIPLDEYVGRNWTKEQKEDWMLPQTYTRIGGKWMGVYWHTLLNPVMYVNKAMLSARNLSIPKSWDELASTAKAITSGRVSGYLIGAHKDGGASGLTVWLIPALWACGADWLDDKHRVAFNNDAGTKPFQYLYEMVHSHKVMPEGMVSMTRDNMLDAFKAATAAMVVLASNTVAAAKQSGVGKDLALAPAPGLTAQKPLPAFSSSKHLVITKDCKEREAAGLFIEEQVGPEAQIINAKVADELPSRKSVLKDPWFNTPEAVHMKVMVDYASRYSRTMDYHPKHFMLCELAAEATQKIILKQKSIKDALDEVAKRWSEEA